jgi:hypothetical protein
LEQNVQTQGRTNSKDAEGSLNKKLRLIQAHEGNATNDTAVCSNKEKVKERRREMLMYYYTCARKPGLNPNTYFAIQCEHKVLPDFTIFFYKRTVLGTNFTSAQKVFVLY